MRDTEAYFVMNSCLLSMDIHGNARLGLFFARSSSFCDRLDPFEDLGDTKGTRVGDPRIPKLVLADISSPSRLRLDVLGLLGRLIGRLDSVGQILRRSQSFGKGEQWIHERSRRRPCVGVVAQAGQGV